MLERSLWLLAVAAIVALGWATLRWRRAAVLKRLSRSAPFAALVPPGRPAVVAFSSPGCVECRALQAPALQRLADAFGDAVVVRTLPADEHPELLARLEVLTVPATAVLDSSGVVRALNLGFADDARLAAQLRTVT